MERLRPLFWGQGLLLQPQHFQQQDEYHDSHLHYLLRMFSPFCWGVNSLRINEAALENFILEVENCEILTFDGTLLRFGADLQPSTARLTPRSFEREFDPSGKPLSVFLGVPRLRPGEGNLGGVDGRRDQNSGVQTRYVLEESEVPDLSAGNDHTCQIQYLVHDAKLLFDVAAERTQEYELVKIAELIRSPDGKGGTLSNRYIPPCISVKSSLALERIIREIRELLTAKGRELGSYPVGGRQGVQLATRDVGQALVVQVLNRYIPLFHHYLESGRIHPESMYALMRQVVGELSTFSQTVSVLGARDGDEGLPHYQHTQLWPCFSMAAERIRQLLDELTTSPIGDVLLKHDGEFFSAALGPEFFDGDNRYYLAIRSPLPPDDLYKQLQNTGKITSREDMGRLQTSALFGLRIEVLQSAPEELAMRAHYRFFLVNQSSDHWQKIRQRGNIAVYSTALPPDTEIRLLSIWGK
ncbi:MAG TPA: type VI secretion system baseplate subunit TssK [Candidatus Binataceae bacterium]|nr:type VI secretion system baseplate subunit TssK [Candidatus Binataceae bacterium]